MDSTEKFTTKVSDYAKYRPTYPDLFIRYLMDEVGLSNSVVADIGAGTGIMTRQLAPEVGSIYAVEPNISMFTVCRDSCSTHDNITMVNACAEETTLQDTTIDFITVAQAFHWFDRTLSQREFRRILKSGGYVTLVWNSRDQENDLIKENDALCRRICPDFKGFSGGSSVGPEHYWDFFKDQQCEYKVFDNDRLISLETYVGGSLSASYAPSPNDDTYAEFVEGLTMLFDKYSSRGLLHFPNKTRSYTGQL